ncbi:MAG: ribonuclease III [Lachnospiraceae bacterium]|nr:ribonuclease III [Lachnospiraceae bacterium]
MEESINRYIRESFGIEEQDIKTYSPLVLAYIGDSVYDLIVRSAVVDRENNKPDTLHKYCCGIVNAGAQARFIESIEEHLTKEEADVFRRGRNAKSSSVAKNASVSDYRKATGFEALIGYLYMTDRFDRIIELLKIGKVFEDKEER